MNRLLTAAVIAGAALVGLTLIPDSAFAVIADLPAHPLWVHGAVVLFPLAASALAVRLWLPRGRTPLLADAILLALTWVGSAASVVAESSGKALAAQIGLPADHAEWGERLGTFAILWFAASVVAVVVARRNQPAWLARLAAPAASIGAAVAIVLVVLTGHSGASAVWSGRVMPEGSGTEITSESTPSAATPASTPAATAPSDSVYSLAQVAEHGSATSCWTAINGSVFDLTPFIAKHPGGAGAITQLCGRDGTSAFTAQHGGQRDPERELASLKIGSLG